MTQLGAPLINIEHKITAGACARAKADHFANRKRISKSRRTGYIPPRMPLLLARTTACMAVSCTWNCLGTILRITSHLMCDLYSHEIHKSNIEVCSFQIALEERIRKDTGQSDTRAVRYKGSQIQGLMIIIELLV